MEFNPVHFHIANLTDGRNKNFRFIFGQTQTTGVHPSVDNKGRKIELDVSACPILSFALRCS